MFKVAFRSLALLCSLFPAAMTSSCIAAPNPLSADKIKTVAPMLADAPAGVGIPISNREFWRRWGTSPQFKALLLKAGELAGTPLADQPDEMFLLYTQTGKYNALQDAMANRRGRISPLTLAECIEDKGRFLPAIEAAVRAVCSERTWILPPSDKDLQNYRGEVTDVDIGSTTLASDLAEADYLLGDRLSAATRALIAENLQRRILNPFRDMATGRRPPNSWMTRKNNLTAVCLAGITAVGLEQLKSRQDRAEIVVAAQTWSRYYLQGFSGDGYCAEGLGYWNYGFGHYLLLSDTILRATNGGVDLLGDHKTRQMALFGQRIQVLEGISPAIGDCSVFVKPSPSIMMYVNRRFDLGLSQYENVDLSANFYSLLGTMVYGLAQDSKPAPAAKLAEVAPEYSLRDWFENTGVLVSRPKPDSPCKLGFVFKGGNNNESHNHNDVGSFVVISNDRPLILDPGRENYTLRTFGPQRYEGKLLNSFGHDVPVVAGQLQRLGPVARGKIISKEFTDAHDTVTMDITSAYDVPALKSLQRTTVYSREGIGSVTVEDHVLFDTPQSFSTALVTLGDWQREADGSLTLYDVNEAVRIDIETGGLPYSVSAEDIREDAPVCPTRIGITLDQSVTDATISMRITPLRLPAIHDGLLTNGDFERGSWGWQLNDGLGELTTTRISHGVRALRIADPDATREANVTSARIAVEPGAKYVLRGQAFHVSGDELGVFADFLNSRREIINPVNNLGEELPITILSGGTGQWIPFQVEFSPVEATQAMQIRFWSKAPSIGEWVLDDLVVEKIK